MRPEYATSRIHRKLRIHRILHVLQLSCHGVVALREVLVVQVIDGFVVGVQVLATGLVLVGVVVRAHLLYFFFLSSVGLTVRWVPPDGGPIFGGPKIGHFRNFPRHF